MAASIEAWVSDITADGETAVSAIHGVVPGAVGTNEFMTGLNLVVVATQRHLIAAQVTRGWSGFGKLAVRQVEEYPWVDVVSVVQVRAGRRQGVRIAVKGLEMTDIPIESSLGPGFVETCRKLMDHDQRTRSGSSVADELEKLLALAKSGALSRAEWQRAKEMFIGQAPDRQAATRRDLSSLYDLHRRGVLSASEYNEKKWDLLSRSMR